MSTLQETVLRNGSLSVNFFFKLLSQWITKIHLIFWQCSKTPPKSCPYVSQCFHSLVKICNFVIVFGTEAEEFLNKYKTQYISNE